MFCTNLGNVFFLFWNAYKRKLLILPTTIDPKCSTQRRCCYHRASPSIGDWGDRGSSSSGTRCSVQHCCFSAVWPINIPDCEAPKRWEILQGDPGTVDTVDFTPYPVAPYGRYNSSKTWIRLSSFSISSILTVRDGAHPDAQGNKQYVESELHWFNEPRNRSNRGVHLATTAAIRRAL